MMRDACFGLALIVIAWPVSATAAATPVEQDSFTGRSFESRHTGIFNGVEVDYTATFADIVLRDADGKAEASIFATAYVRDGVDDGRGRPVIFFWNGGPSASSQTLHMAGFGPRRLVVPEDVSAPVEPPYRTQPNTHTLLDVADLVFVDPVGTGFSRVLPAGDRARFYSVKGDAESIARFIRQWLSAYGRADAPRYVVGTSYGSIRAVMVAGVLAGTDMPLDGAILFSQGVNLVETTQRENNVIGYASNFSQQAAIAWYHGRTAFQDRPVVEVIDRAQRFAMTDYLVALGTGNRLPEAEQRTLAERLAAFTGIGSGYFRTHGLAIRKSEFRRKLLEDEGRVLGMTDARYTTATDSGDGPAEPTRGVPEVQQRHMKEFLGVDLPWDQYRAMAPDAFNEWDWGGTSTLDGSAAPPGARRTVFADFDYPGALVPAFDANDGFALMIATGIYDTQTTVGPARLLASDTRYPRDRVVQREYEAGHTFYAYSAAFERLANDIRQFIH
jgi:carboxypeptidase C (cathepsin A)